MHKIIAFPVLWVILTSSMGPVTLGTFRRVWNRQINADTGLSGNLSWRRQQNNLGVIHSWYMLTFFYPWVWFSAIAWNSYCALPQTQRPAAHEGDYWFFFKWKSVLGECLCCSCVARSRTKKFISVPFNMHNFIIQALNQSRHLIKLIQRSWVPKDDANISPAVVLSQGSHIFFTMSYCI